MFEPRKSISFQVRMQGLCGAGRGPSGVAGRSCWQLPVQSKLPGMVTPKIPCVLSETGPGRPNDRATRRGTARYMVTFWRTNKRGTTEHCQHAWRDFRGDLAEAKVLRCWEKQSFTCKPDCVEEIEGSYKK